MAVAVVDIDLFHAAAYPVVSAHSSQPGVIRLHVLDDAVSFMPAAACPVPVPLTAAPVPVLSRPAAAAGAPAEDAVEAAVAAAAAFGLINGVGSAPQDGRLRCSDGSRSAAGRFVVGGDFTGAGVTVAWLAQAG